MCRNIKMLHNFKPPATEEEIRASSLQFVRKLSGFNKPSKANEEAFNRAVDQVAQAAHDLLDSLVTTAPARDREVEQDEPQANRQLHLARSFCSQRLPRAIGVREDHGRDERHSRALVCCLRQFSVGPR